VTRSQFTSIFIFTVFMSVNNAFTVVVFCKRYIKTYLETNCGTPVDLSRLDLQDDFRKLLRKDQSPSSRVNAFKYSVTIVIPPDDFYRHGFSLSHANMLLFNSVVEKQIKHEMRVYLSLFQAFGMHLPKAILQFQETFDINEADWSLEGIKKDYYRNACSLLPRKRKLLFQDIKADLLSQFKSIYSDGSGLNNI